MLAFLSFLVAILARFFRPEFIHHDPITLFNLTELFLIFSIALYLHSNSQKP